MLAVACFEHHGVCHGADEFEPFVLGKPVCDDGGGSFGAVVLGESAPVSVGDGVREVLAQQQGDSGALRRADGDLVGCADSFEVSDFEVFAHFPDGFAGLSSGLQGDFHPGHAHGLPGGEPEAAFLLRQLGGAVTDVPRVAFAPFESVVVAVAVDHRHVVHDADAVLVPGVGVVFFAVGIAQVVEHGEFAVCVEYGWACWAAVRFSGVAVIVLSSGG